MQIYREVARIVGKKLQYIFYPDSYFCLIYFFIVFLFICMHITFLQTIQEFSWRLYALLSLNILAHTFSEQRHSLGTIIKIYICIIDERLLGDPNFPSSSSCVSIGLASLAFCILPLPFTMTFASIIMCPREFPGL